MAGIQLIHDKAIKKEPKSSELVKQHHKILKADRGEISSVQSNKKTTQHKEKPITKSKNNNAQQKFKSET